MSRKKLFPGCMLHAAQKNCLAVVRFQNYSATLRPQSFSVLRQFFRQFFLALMHIHYLTDIDLDIVLDLFAKMHPRRLELGTLLKDRDDQQPAE